MSDNTKIEWADATLNYANGCSVLTPGCTNCYAMKQAHRFPVRQGLTVKTKGGMVWIGDVRINARALDQALAWKRGRRIFWNAHGDLFHEKVTDEQIDRLFAVCAMTPQHTHMILTKRSARMREYLSSSGVRDEIWSCAKALPALTDFPRKWPLPNVWLGVSVEDQARADERIPDLLATPAAVRFLSCEPLLAEVDLECIVDAERSTHGPGSFTINALTGTAERAGMQSYVGAIDLASLAIGKPQAAKLDWVIAGGESGPGARPMHPDWARSLRDQCAAAGVAFHFKQWGEWFPYGEIDADGHQNSRDRGERPGLWHEWPGANSGFAVRIGKKQAGRRLDGLTHDAFPGS